MTFGYEDNQKNEVVFDINPLNVELNPICHFLALLGARHILHIGRIRFKLFAPDVAHNS
jgi:hypothetical protein